VGQVKLAVRVARRNAKPSTTKDTKAHEGNLSSKASLLHRSWDLDIIRTHGASLRHKIGTL